MSKMNTSALKLRNADVFILATPPGMSRQKTQAPQKLAVLFWCAILVLVQNPFHRTQTRFHRAGAGGVIVFSRYAASDDTCISDNGPPSALANPGIIVCGLPRAMIPFQ